MVLLPRNGPRFYRLVLPFTITSLAGTLAADAGYWSTREAVCAEAASWLASAALATLLVALIAGALDGSLRHLFASGSALLLVVVNVLMREGANTAAVLPAGPFLSALAAAILLYTWFTRPDRIATPRPAWREVLAHRARSFHLHQLGR